MRVNAAIRREIDLFLMSLPATLRASTTRQRLAKALRSNASPLVAVARPRSETDVAMLDESVASEMKRSGIDPEGQVGRFIRDRVRERSRLRLMPAARSGDGIAAESPPSGNPDLEHSIHSGLVLFIGSHPEGSAQLGTERVTEETVTPFGAADFTRVHPDESDWRCLDVRSTTSAGASLPRSVMDPLTDTNVSTIWADIVFDVVGYYGVILSAPAGSGWSTPWAEYIAGRQSDTTSCRLFRDATNVIGPSDSFPTSAGRRRIWITRNAGTFKFGVDGAQVGSDASGLTADWNFSDASEPLSVFNRSSTSTGEGIDGALLRLMVWDRVLSSQELSDLNSNPQLGLLA